MYFQGRQMDSNEDMFKIFNEYVFLVHSEGGNDVKVNVLRKYIIHRFHNTITSSRILTTLSLIDDIILKLHCRNLEGIQDDMYSVRENVMYMLSFEKFVDEDTVCDENDDDNDVENEQMSHKFLLLSKNTNTNIASSHFQNTCSKS